MSNHTPPPWRVIETNLLPYDGDHVADLSNELMVVASSELGDPLADALLIAAAPELLEALKDCRQALVVGGFTDELLVVDAAIKKATGITK